MSVEPMTLRSSSGLVVLKSASPVLHIELNRPEEQNSLNYAMMMALADLVAAGQNDEAVRSILISGAGDDFCAGDTPWDPGPWPERLANRNSAGAHGPASLVEQSMLRIVRASSKPVVAALKGKVLGLGLDLAAVCDFRLAADDAVLGDPRILQARHAGTGLTYVLPRLIGQSRATWMMLTGESMTAAEAMRIGLAHQICARAALDEEAGVLADRLANLPTRAFAVKKEMTLAQLDLGFETAMMHCLAVRQTNVIEDRAEGVSAWRERRPPRFTGR